MLYPVCPTCQNLLADKQLKYEEELEKICNNKKLNDEQMQIKKEKLLDDIGLTRYCCRMRIISYVNQVKLIV
jgi:DNA-directed RNA polymerase subunit N (RpoN/RPB10)